MKHVLINYYCNKTEKSRCFDNRNLQERKITIFAVIRTVKRSYFINL